MKALYIVGDSRSGSSLFQHLLSLQNSVTALGEIHRLEKLVRDGERCACGKPVSECDFWSQAAWQAGLRLGEAGTRPDFRFLRHRFGQLTCWAALKFGLEKPALVLLRQERRAANNCLALYEATGKLTDSRIVVDSSKDPTQFLRLYLTGGDFVRPVLLVRDGRAVVWSKLQRHKGLEVATAARRWLNVSRKMLALQEVLPEANSNFVYYENLCKDPVGSLERILAQEGTPVQSTSLRESPNERHYLGGSPRFRTDVPDSIQVDERWRAEMPKEALDTFERIAGPMNRRLGYD